MAAQIPDSGVTWNIRVSTEADRSVRGFLERAGLPAEALPQFVEEAVRWRLLRIAVEQARTGFAGLEPEALDALIEEATDAVREERRGAAS